MGVVLYCVSRIPYPSAVCGWDLGRNPYIVFRNRILCWWQLGLSTVFRIRIRIPYPDPLVVGVEQRIPYSVSVSRIGVALGYG